MPRVGAGRSWLGRASLEERAGGVGFSGGAMMREMAVQGLYALQNGFMGFERSGLFYGEFSGDRVRIPIACWLVRTSEAMILFDTGLSPRAVPGLLRNDPLARFTEEDLLVHRLDLVGLEPDNVDMVVLSHLHYDHAGGAALFPKSELVVQKDEYSYAHYPSSFFESFYYRRNFDLAGYHWRLLDGDTELLPGVTIFDRTGTRRAISRCWSSCPSRGRSFSPATPATGTSTPTKSACPASSGTRPWRCTRSGSSRRSRGSCAVGSFPVTTRSSGKPSSRRRTLTAEAVRAATTRRVP